MPTYLHGAGGAPGIAIGRVVRYTSAGNDGRLLDSSPEAAVQRFVTAQATAVARLRTQADRLRAEGHVEGAAILDAQSMLVEDPTITDAVVQRVRESGEPLELALDAVIAETRTALEALDDRYLRERAADADAVGREIRKALRGMPAPQPELTPDAIVLAADLTPTETAELRGRVAGVATIHGGPNGHTLILARSLGMPAVVGLGPQAYAVADGAPLILDGDSALLIVDPDQRALEQYTNLVRQAALAPRRIRREQPGQLADGRRVSLYANISRPDEAVLASDQGAEGIGLFRTEFMFLGRVTPPSEDEQYAAYRSVLAAMGTRPVTVRTFDVGGDKPLPYLRRPYELNPFLGVRGIRLCIEQPELFLTQVRALLRAALHGNLAIMLPMVATPDDLAWGRARLKEAAAQLEAAGVPHRADVPLGVMIETPAAAVTADLLARQAAFFSIGSNDLAQYVLAADRGAGDLAQRYPPDAPAVLRLIDMAATAALRAGIGVSVCGEIAGIPEIAPVLVGMGIAELSMAPALIPATKERLSEISFDQAQALARRALLREGL